MTWTTEQTHQADDEHKAHLLRLYAEGRYLELCTDYCHEGWDIYCDGTGAIIDMGICSYRVYGSTEADGLAIVAEHIKAEILAGVLGC